MATASPLFTVVVPTYARPGPLEACLQAFTRIDYPRDRFELIVVDDGSPESLKPVVAEFDSTLNLHLITRKNGGPAAARNTGAAHATGTFLAFTDDDCVPHPTWLHALADRLEEAPDRLVGGRTFNALPENPFATSSEQLIMYLYAYFNGKPDKTGFFTSNNMALSAEYFHRIGGFDARFPLAAGEDRDFCERWCHAGYAMEYAPEAIIHHAHNLTLRRFWRQHFNYGRGAYYYHSARAERTHSSIKPEPFPFYLDLLRFPFSQNEVVS